MKTLPLEPMSTPGSMLVTGLLVGIAMIVFLELRQWWDNRSKK